MKKEYSSPELTRVFLNVQTVVLASGPEYYSSYIDDGDDWGDDGGDGE